MKFSKGSIVRIYLENFVAFDRIELKPKNKLNLIIGANGSGKSTFVCAIVLGLGGKPNIIGRSPNVSDYVKHGQEKAIIDLELFNPDGSNFIISRHIFSNSSSTWFLQNKAVPFKKVEALIAELNIQINNLCQILPQDRVQDFAKMDQKALLENTQKSIGDNQMCEWFYKLKSFRTSIVDRENTLAEKKKKLDEEMQRNKRMEEDVRSHQEKQDILNKIAVIQKKLQWLIYEEKNECRKKAQEDYKHAQDNYEKLKNDFQPLLKIIQEAEKKQGNINNKIKAENNNKVSLNNKLKDFVRIHLRNKDKITSTKQELKSLLDAETQKEKQITELQKHLQEMENQANLSNDLSYFDAEAQKKKQISELQKHLQEMENQANLSNENTLNTGIREIDLAVDALLKKVSYARNCESEVNDKSMAINQSVRALEHKIQQINSVKEKKLEILSNFEDVRKAYDWLQENRNQFEGNVYGPLFMEVNVENSNFARHMEHIVSWRDLVAFVCEDAKDMSKLLRILRDGMKLKINAITSTPLEASLSELFPPRIPLSQLRNLGFHSYLIDLLDGPDIILKYMCTSFGFHTIPVGNHQVENNLDSMPKDLRAFFSESTFYKINYSKYSGEKLQSVTTIGGSRFLSVSVNKDLLKTCNEELLVKKSEYEILTKQLAEMADLRKGYDVEINSLRNNKREMTRKLEYLKAYNVRLRLMRDELAQLVNKKINPLTEEAKAQIQIESYLKEMIASEIDSIKVMEQYSSSCNAISLLKLELECLGSLIRKKENDSRELEAAVVASRDEAERLKSECTQIRTELKVLHNKAKELCEGLDATDERFKEKYLPLFRELPGDRIMLEDHLHETQAIAQCLPGSLNDRVLQDFEESNKLLKVLEKEVTQLKVSAAGIQDEAKEILESWLPKIEKLIDAINDRFGAFFAAMGCAGVVQLDLGSDSSVYENYGLAIKVKFRNEGDLQVLDSHTQSGGERALTTAVYLLSLQAITSVPFRCVDEINQGMDEINEKRVYHLIMNSISTCDTAQYFLVTPTLFMDVSYPDGTSVHCVHCTTEDDESDGVIWSKERYFANIGIPVDS